MDTSRETQPASETKMTVMAEPPKLVPLGSCPPGVDKKHPPVRPPVDEDQILKWLTPPEERD